MSWGENVHELERGELLETIGKGTAFVSLSWVAFRFFPEGSMMGGAAALGLLFGSLLSFPFFMEGAQRAVLWWKTRKYEANP